MTVTRSTSLVPAILLLFASFTRLATAQTATLKVPPGLPASCTPLATLLSAYPPPTDGKVVDDALNNGIDAYYSQYVATATAKPTASLNHASLCDFIISTQIPSASPSATPALSSYISAAGIWLEDHGLEEAESLLEGDCQEAVQSGDDMAIGDLDFVIAFGPCYTLLGWDQRAATISSATTTSVATTSVATTHATTTSASSAPTITSSGSGSVQVTPSPTGQSSDASATPSSSGSKRAVGEFGILGMTLGIILLLSL
ncbi:hypothetical protein F4825DRAFT_421877 [Nemania diffusa]|nr:hypothetical protein F4825DRAFT_421877 [Nemania diffusa]